MRLLNIGCGTRFHDEWINIDIKPVKPQVREFDITKRIPFPEDHFDVVYHSHLLEHLPVENVFEFMNDCFRVLKAGGIIRVVVPDLEQIAALYLESLKGALAGETIAEHKYDWIMLEMYDQTVRDCSGGRMAEYLRQNAAGNDAFVISRCGSEAKKLIESQKKSAAAYPSTGMKRKASQFQKQQGVFKQFKERVVKMLLGPEYQYLQSGRFRKSGEIHQWMYDEYSLGRLLEQSGFVGICKRKHDESYIPDWQKYFLDTESDGTIYKPDSLYMEAIKQ